MILVTGCNPLGTRIVDAMAAEMARGACDHTCPDIPRGYQTYDALSAESITRLVDELRPSVIVLTEEASDVDYCEQHRMDAMQFNTRSVRFFVDAAQKAGSRVVYKSTPFVFDGRKPGGLYTESDNVNPINVYGETRLMGEVHSDKVREFLIVRVGELYGSYPENFASHVYNQIRAGQKVELARDMYFSPVLIDDAVKAIKTSDCEPHERVVQCRRPGACQPLRVRPENRGRLRSGRQPGRASERLGARHDGARAHGHIAGHHQA